MCSCQDPWNMHGSASYPGFSLEYNFWTPVNLCHFENWGKNEMFSQTFSKVHFAKRIDPSNLIFYVTNFMPAAWQAYEYVYTSFHLPLPPL